MSFIIDRQSRVLDLPVDLRPRLNVRLVKHINFFADSTLDIIRESDETETMQAAAHLTSRYALWKPLQVPCEGSLRQQEQNAADCYAPGFYCTTTLSSSFDSVFLLLPRFR